MEPRFGLRLSNKILLGILFSAKCLAFLFFAPKNSYNLGGLFGALLAYLTLSYPITWIAWRVSGRSRRVSEITFNVILIMVALGQLGRFNATLEQRRIADEQFDQVLQEYTDTQKTSGDNWRTTFDIVQSNRVLNFANLEMEQDYVFQRDAVSRYIASTSEFQTLFDTTMMRLEGKLKDFGTNNNRVRNVLAGARDEYEKQRPIMTLLLAAHREYGGHMLTIIKALEEYKGKWRVVKGDLQYDDDDLRAIVLQALEKKTECESRIYELSVKLRQNL